MVEVIYRPGDTRVSKIAALKAVEDAMVTTIRGMEVIAQAGNYFLLDSLTSCAYEAIRRFEELGGFKEQIDCSSDEPSARLVEADSWQVYYMVHDYSFRLKCEMMEKVCRGAKDGVQEN